MNDELICPKCNEITYDNQNCIHCDICCKWYHLKCSGLYHSMFLQLGNDLSSDWYCKTCLSATLPFQNNSQSQFLAIAANDKKACNPPKCFDKTCSVCTRRVSNIEKAVPCHFCEKYIHRKCSYLSEQQNY